MQITYIENILTNFSFSFLFCMMIYYWFRIAFSHNFVLSKQKTSSGAMPKGKVLFISKQNVVASLPPLVTTSLVRSEGSNVTFWFQRNLTGSVKTLWEAKLPFYGMIFTNLSIASLLLLRWVQSTHLPLSNLYESLLFLTWSITLIQIIIEKTNNFYFLGVLLCPLSLLIFGFANLSLPSEMQNITPLVPALQSNWLLMHVSIMILSYGTLLCGCIFSITYLFLSFFNLNERFLQKQDGFKETMTASLPSERTKGGFSTKLDNLSYRMLGIGFSFLTIGILSGAVWANETWGSYWSWDPKETWAFITWLTFAIYLHSRLNYGWQGKKPAIIASVGFFIIWVCYLGVNLLGKGLHSYGWIQGS